MYSKQLLERALNKEFLSVDEGQFLFENVPTTELMFIANELRQPSTTATQESSSSVAFSL